MSRIQNILEKAERDGAVRRVRGAEQAGPATLAAMEGPATITAPPPVMESFGSASSGILDALGAAAATAVPMEPPAHVVTGARLDRRLIAASTDSVAGEQYRALRTRILHADNGTAVNVLLVTSPGRGEGKTTTAGNLALTMAQDYQRRICLVDADLRHPQLQHMFGLPAGPGLADVLTGQATLDEALVTIEEHQITLLPAGHIPAHPAELLGTTAMRRLLDTLRSRFDRVVVDSPSTAPLADVGVLTPLVDSVLLVVRSSVTSKPAIHDAVAALDGAKLLGVVLNDAA
jgi:capsular exopolysaccharide synthesis family protein